MGDTRAPQHVFVLNTPLSREKPSFLETKFAPYLSVVRHVQPSPLLFLRIIGSVHEITQEGAAWLSKVLNGLLTSNVSSRYMFPPLFVFIVLPRVED